MHQRKFTVAYDLAGDEVYSRIQIRRTDSRAEARFRQRRTLNANPSSWIAVVTPMPEGVETSRQGALRALWATQLAWQVKRQRAYPNQLLPEAVAVMPYGLPEPWSWKSLRRWTPPLEAWQKRRQHAIEGSLNDIAFSYAQGSWGEPLGDILGEIQRHMLEKNSFNRGLYWYDGLWTAAEVLDYAQDRVNQFLLQSGLSRETASVSVSTSGQVTVPDSLVLRRAIWFSNAGDPHPLELGDVHTADSADPGWEQTSAEIPERLISWGRGRWELHPRPSSAGTVLLDYVPLWDLSATPALAIEQMLPLPAIFAPYIKYGIMADMLGKEGEVHDEKRATYCEERFNEGIEIAKMFMGRTD